MKEKIDKWYMVDKKDTLSFLSFALSNNCRWISGNNILPSSDDCSVFMSIKDGTLSRVPFAHFVRHKDEQEIVQYSEVAK